VENKNKEKKPYKAPAFRKVSLEVKTSVLAVCSLSTPVSPTLGTCTQPGVECQFLT